MSRFARPLVALFNVEGTLDLVTAIILGTVYDASFCSGGHLALNTPRCARPLGRVRGTLPAVVRIPMLL